MTVRVLQAFGPRHGDQYAVGELVIVRSRYKHHVDGHEMVTITDTDGRRWTPCVPARWIGDDEMPDIREMVTGVPLSDQPSQEMQRIIDRQNKESRIPMMLEPGVKLTTLKPPLTLDKMDSNGYVPRRELLGSTWKHTNGKIYRILDFEWNSESDQWMLSMKCDDDPVRCLRGLHNFFAANEHGVKRYTAVSR